jgi:taurine dehydrogenase small subunit
MSQENFEMVRRAFDAYNRGDLDAVVTDFASDCEYVSSGALPGGRGVYQGPEGYKRFIGWIKDEFEDAHVDVNDLTDAGDRVLASLTLRGRGRQSGAATTWDLWHVWTVRSGRFVHGQAFTSKTEALEAAGLSE